MNTKKKVAPARKPAPKKVAASKKKVAVKKTAPKRVVAPKKKVAVKKPESKKHAVKGVTTQKKKVAVKKTIPKKAAAPKKAPLPKKPVSGKTTAAQVAAKKPVPKKTAVTIKATPKKAPVKSVVATRPAPRKADPKAQTPPKAVKLEKVDGSKPETEAPRPATTEWIGTSAMRVIPCPDCGAKAGEWCVSKDTNKVILETHHARIMAYVANKPEARLPVAGQQQAIGKGRLTASPEKNEANVGAKNGF